MYIVMGNGESRRAVSFDLLKNHTTYGCNALYRDFTPSALVAIDELMYYEIISSGYSKNNQCYFSNFELIPAEAYPMMRSSAAPSVEVFENDKTDYMFAWMGRELKRAYNFETRLYEMKEEPCYVCTWVEPNHCIINMDSILGEGIHDSGQQACRLICEVEKPDTVYILGFDLSNNDGKVNNVYKNTINYAPSVAGAVDPFTWMRDLNVIFDKYQDTEFIHIQDSKVLDIETISVQNFINILKDY